MLIQTGAGLSGQSRHWCEWKQSPGHPCLWSCNPASGNPGRFPAAFPQHPDVLGLLRLWGNYHQDRGQSGHGHSVSLGFWGQWQSKPAAPTVHTELTHPPCWVFAKETPFSTRPCSGHWFHSLCTAAWGVGISAFWGPGCGIWVSQSLTMKETAHMHQISFWIYTCLCNFIKFRTFL